MVPTADFGPSHVHRVYCLACAIPFYGILLLSVGFICIYEGCGSYSCLYICICEGYGTYYYVYTAVIPVGQLLFVVLRVPSRQSSITDGEYVSFVVDVGSVATSTGIPHHYHTIHICTKYIIAGDREVSCAHHTIWIYISYVYTAVVNTICTF